jgi:hypothetical protein
MLGVCFFKGLKEGFTLFPGTAEELLFEEFPAVGVLNGCGVYRGCALSLPVELS